MLKKLNISSKRCYPMFENKLLSLSYAPHLLEPLPRIIDKLDSTLIDTFFNIVVTKHDYTLEKIRSRIMDRFIPRFIHTIEILEQAHLPFCFDELQRIQSKVSKNILNHIDLESIVLG